MHPLPTLRTLSPSEATRLARAARHAAARRRAEAFDALFAAIGRGLRAFASLNARRPAPRATSPFVEA